MDSCDDHSDHNMGVTLETLITCSWTDIEQIECIKNLLVSSQNTSKRKKFLKLLDKIDCENQLSVMASIISKITNDVMLHSTSVSSIRTTTDILKLLSESSSKSLTIVEMNFPVVIEFCLNTLRIVDESLRSKLNKTSELELIDSLHFFLQTLLIVTEKSLTFRNVDSEMMRKLYYALRRLLKYEQIPLNTMNNCGLLIVILDYNYFELTSSFRLLKRSLNFAAKEHLAICFGFVVAVPTDLLICPLPSSSEENSSLVVLILKSIHLLYHKYPNDCIILTSCLKILFSMTDRVSFSEKNEPIPSEWISFVTSFLWLHLDHFQDIIKHLSRDCTRNVLRRGVPEAYCAMKFAELFIAESRDIDRRTCVLLSCLSDAGCLRSVYCYRPTLPIELLDAAKKDVSFSYIPQLFIKLMVSSFYEHGPECCFEFFIKPLLSFTYISTTWFNDAVCEAAKLSPSIANEILKFCRSADKKNYLMVVKCVLVLNKLNLNNDVDNENEKRVELWRNSVPLAFMAEAVRSPGSEEAVATARLILESCKKNTPFTSDELKLLGIYLNSNISTLDSSQCSILLPLANQIILGLKEKMNLHGDSNEINDMFSSLSRQCFENLCPGASFSRRYIVLKILEIMQNVDVWHLKTCDSQQKFLILTYLGDSFDENKTTAKKLIQSTSFPGEILNEDQLRTLYVLIVDMISSARFCEHDTAIYLLELFLNQPCWIDVYRNCFLCLEGASANAPDVDAMDICRGGNRFYYPLRVLAEVLSNRLRSQDPEECLRTRPVYGFLILAMRLFEYVCQNDQSLLDSDSENRWKELIATFCELCIEYNLLSTSVVSQSSPEGYLPPEEFEFVAEDSTSCYSSAQRLLLNSWRTVKEASLMLAFFVNEFASSPNVETDKRRKIFMDEELMMKIGSHLVSLIRGIKHRGAFEQVYIALCHYCRCCWRSSTNETIGSLPQTWLEDLVVSLERGESTSDLCTLRRSAGLPYIVQAILSTEYDGKNRKRSTSQSLKAFVGRLFDICERETNADAGDDALESKIHASNILRALFRNKDLDEQMNQFVERAVVLAVQGVQSSFWSERNVSWLLFSSLMTKMFGVARYKRAISSKNKMTVKMFFRKYPSLYEFFKNQLLAIGKYEASDAYARSSLYPILLIFQRLEVHSGSSRQQYDTFELNSFIPLLFQCSRSPVWKIRELVVLAIYPFITVDIYESYITTLWKSFLTDSSENFRHGLLMQLETLLSNVQTMGAGLIPLMQPKFSSMLEEALEILENLEVKYCAVVERLLWLVITWLLKLQIETEEKREFTEVLRKRLTDVLILRLKKCLQEEQDIHFQKGIQTEDLMAAFVCVSSWYWIPVTVIDFLEKFIQEEKFGSNVMEKILEIICLFVSDSEFVPRDTMLRNVRDIYTYRRDRARESKIFYSFVMENTSEDFNTHYILYLRAKILLAFLGTSQWLMDERSKICLKALLQQHNILDEDLLDILVQCVGRICESSTSHQTSSVRQDSTEDPADICLSTLNILTDYRLDTYSDDVCELLIKFYFKYCRCLWRDKNPTTLRLKVWSFMFLYAVSSSNYSVQCEIECFLPETNTLSLLERLMEEFHVETNSEHLFAATAFLSWILRHFDALCNNDNTNTIFVQNVPQSLENDLIISRLASVHLNRVITDHPDVLSLPLDEELSSWIRQRCGLDTEHFTNLREFIDIITRIHGDQAAEDGLSIAALRADSWRFRMLSSKMHLLPNKNDCKSTGKNTCI